MKRLFKYAALLIAILIFAVAALFFLVDANQFRPELESQLNQALQRSVHLGDLQVSLLSGGASSSELTISDDPAFSGKQFLKSGLVEIGVDASALIFSRKLHVRSFTIDDAEVTLIRKPDGSWNFSNLGSAPPASAAAVPPTAVAPSAAAPEPSPTELLVNLIRIDNARVHLVDGGTTREFAKVNFELRDFSRTSTMPFSLTADVLGSGNVKLTGTGGPIAANVAETPFNTQVEIDGWHLGGGAPDGVLQIRGNANSNGKTAAVTGAIVIDKLKLAKTGTAATHPVALNFALAHDLKTRRGNLARSTIKLGSATANLQGSYNLGVDPNMDLTLDGTNMALPELLDFLPAIDVQLPAGSTLKGGTISTNITMRNRGAALSTTGTVKIEKARLENYNLGAKLGVLKQFVNVPMEASTEIALASSDFENNAGGTQLRNVRMDAPALGQLTGTGSVSPSHELNLHMKAVIRGTTVPFLIRGTSSNPSFQPDIGRFAQDQLQEALRDPEGAAKKGNSIVNKAKGLLDFFKRGKKKDGGQK